MKWAFGKEVKLFRAEKVVDYTPNSKDSNYTQEPDYVNFSGCQNIIGKEKGIEARRINI